VACSRCAPTRTGWARWSADRSIRAVSIGLLAGGALWRFWYEPDQQFAVSVRLINSTGARVTPEALLDNVRTDPTDLKLQNGAEELLSGAAERLLTKFRSSDIGGALAWAHTWSPGEWLVVVQASLGASWDYLRFSPLDPSHALTRVDTMRLPEVGLALSASCYLCRLLPLAFQLEYQHVTIQETPTVGALERGGQAHTEHRVAMGAFYSAPRAPNLQFGADINYGWGLLPNVVFARVATAPRATETGVLFLTRYLWVE
jgi:hypothetical protein